MATLKSIGKKIAEERLRQNLTQEDLAGMAEIDRSFLSNIENGKKNFSVITLLKISHALNVSTSSLLN